MINVIILISIALIVIILFNLYLNLILKKVQISKKIFNFFLHIFFSVLLFLFLDNYLFKKFGHGFPSSFNEEVNQRSPAPYDMFSGKPNYKDHNSDGFRGGEFKNSEGRIQIAFFGGSTGYNGEPPIIDLIKQKLDEKEINIDIFNFSSVSSNHNQHVHRLVKFLEYNFDIVIFYGGYNETIQSYLYDPRPGFPFNYWVRNELSRLKYFLLKNSSILAEYEKKTGKITNINLIRKDNNYPSDQWIDKILDNYETQIQKAKNLTEKIVVKHYCSKSKFFAFYQPISIQKSDAISKKIIQKSVMRFKSNNDVIDISNSLEEKYFTDPVHISQLGKEIIASEILSYMMEHINNKCL